MRLVILGSGNVATCLGKLSTERGHNILQVMSKNVEHASQLAAQLNCAFTTEWNKIEKGADAYIVAISDGALEALSHFWNCGNKLVVHTAGSVSMHVLKDVSKNYGVMYPLQTLRKDFPLPESIPLLVDANTPDDLALVTDLAQGLSSMVKKTNDEERLRLHVAAVMVNNFTNFIYAVAQEFCEREKLDFQLLHPLIKETVERLDYGSAAQMQTGPAIRNDEDTIRKHLSLLDAYPQAQALYEYLSKSIATYLLKK